MALSRAHTPAKAADVAKLLLFCKEAVSLSHFQPLFVNSIANQCNHIFLSVPVCHYYSLSRPINLNPKPRSNPRYPLYLLLQLCNLYHPIAL